MKNNRFIYLLIALMAIWLLILSFRPADSKPSDEQIIVNEYNVSGFSTDFTKIIEENESGIVSISSNGNILSGFVYRQEEEKVYIVTAYHGVADGGDIFVRFGSTYTQSASLLGYDVFTDLAVLEVDTPYLIQELKIGDSTLLKKGEFVISIGTPQSLDYAGTVDLGMIADNGLCIDNSITVDEERYSYYLDVIEISSDMKAGYSGSPLLNMNGEVTGMNTMALNNSLHFALTANELRIVADRIISGNLQPKWQLGIKGTYISAMQNYEKTELDLDIQTLSGLYVQKVRDNSVAYNAGVRPGDVIVRINDLEIRNLNDLLAVSYGEADDFVFELLRGGETLSLGIVND